MGDGARQRGPLWLPGEAVWLSAGVDFARVRPVDHIAAIAPRPLLLLGGSLEIDTPPPVTERTFAAAEGPKRLWIVAGADHGKYLEVQPEAYERTVMTFLEESFFRR